MGAFPQESSPPTFSSAVFAVGGHGLIPVTDAVNRPEAFKAAPKLSERLADLRDVLIQRAATHIGVHPPDRMDQAVPADDDAGIGVQVIKDAEFLPAELAPLAAAEDQLEALGMHFHAIEKKDASTEVRVAGEPAVTGSLAATKHRVDPRDEFFGMVRLADEIIGAGFERCGDLRPAALGGKEDDGGRVI